MQLLRLKSQILLFICINEYFNLISVVLGHEMKVCTGAAKEKQGEVRVYITFVMYKLNLKLLYYPMVPALLVGQNKILFSCYM